MRLARGEMALIAWAHDGEPKAWAAVFFDQMPNLRALFIYAIYAPGQTGPEMFDALCQYAKAGGASRIRGACDEAISRLWARKGFTEAYRIMEKEL